ncbi:hypothetical protein GQ457_04G013460 [Hibiscus cannabinus]
MDLSLGFAGGVVERIWRAIHDFRGLPKIKFFICLLVKVRWLNIYSMYIHIFTSRTLVDEESNTAIVLSELWVYKVLGVTVLTFGGQSAAQRLHTSGESISKAVASIPRHGFVVFFLFFYFIIILPMLMF